METLGKWLLVDADTFRLLEFELFWQLEQKHAPQCLWSLSLVQGTVHSVYFSHHKRGKQFQLWMSSLEASH